jgi:hypothetical protein
MSEETETPAERERRRAKEALAFVAACAPEVFKIQVDEALVQQMLSLTVMGRLDAATARARAMLEQDGLTASSTPARP